MYIEIDAKAYELRSSSDLGISMDYKNPELPIIYAHPHMSMDQIQTFVKQNKHSLISPSEQIPELLFLKIQLMDQQVAIKINRGHKFAVFWKGDMAQATINAHSNPENPKIQQEIAEQLFEQYINNCVSFWEEQFGELVGEIKFRTMKKNRFTCSKEYKNLVFNRNNKQFSKRINDYLVCKAVFTLQNHQVRKAISPATLFKDFTQLERIMEYGY